jgi:hypothetical protein
VIRLPAGNAATVRDIFTASCHKTEWHKHVVK